MAARTTLVFMAAGFGSRFGGGVKQIEPIGPHGEVLMDYAAHDAIAAGFSRIVFIIRRDLEQAFRAGVGSRVEKKCDVEYVFQDLDDLPAGFSVPAGRVKPWGTGQAILACRHTINGPFCVLNADDYYGAEAFRRIYDRLTTQAEDRDAMQLCMAGYALGNTLSESGSVTRGVCRIGADDCLLDIQETRGIVLRDGVPCIEEDGQARMLDPATPVSMNIWGLPARFMDYLREEFPRFLESMGENALHAEFLLPTLVGRMIKSGRGTVQVLPTSDRWFGMTYARDRQQARERIQEHIALGHYPEWM